jgi:DNA-binding GntR family transcriptional regulator
MDGVGVLGDVDPSQQGSIVLARVFSRRFPEEDDRGSRVGQIAMQVALDIIEGRILAGSEIPAQELARRFDSSRTPVREALVLLHNEGLIDIPPRRRPRVAALSKGEVAEIYRLRAELNAIVARGAAAHANEDGILESSFERLSAAAMRHDVDEYFWANVEFHDALATLAGDRTVKRVVDSLGLRVLQLRHIGLSRPGRIERSFADHERLVVALREGDADLAGALCRSIVLSALPVITEGLPNEE